MAHIWLSSSELAQLAGTSRQNTHKAMKRALSGGTWLHTPIVVRLAKGNAGGGRRGVRYEALLESLPLHLQASFTHISEAPERHPKAPSVANEKDPKSFPLAQKRYDIIASVLVHPKGSTERRAAIDAAAGPGQSKESIARWIKAFEDRGMVGLLRDKPSNAGKSRVIVSREFDAAYIEAGYDPAQLPEDQRAIGTPFVG